MSSSTGSRSVSPRAGGDAPSYNYKHPARRIPLGELRREETARFVIFNIGDDDAIAVRGWLKAAIPDRYDQIQRVEIVTHVSGQRRAVLWVRRELGDGLKRSVLAAFKDGMSPHVRKVLRTMMATCRGRSKFPWYWRIDVYRPWRDRQKLKARPETVLREECRNILTWNVNGFHSKSEEIEEALKVAFAPLKAFSRRRGQLALTVVDKVLGDLPQLCPAPIAAAFQTLANTDL